MPPQRDLDFVSSMRALSITTSCPPLGPPFSLSSTREKNTRNPPEPSYDLSPQSSPSSSSEFSSVSSASSHDAFDAFVRTQSRVVRLSNLPPMPQFFLASVFAQHRLAPTTMWVMRMPAGAADFSVWAVFHTHREACAALSLSSPRMSVATALESDLEPFTKLKRFELGSNAGPPQLFMTPQRVLRIDALAGNASSPSFAAVHGGGGGASMPLDGYTLSSNPPNPRATFRPGDWICPSQNCAQLNFARNLSCFACACPRPNGTPSATAAQAQDTPQSPHHFSHSQLPPSRPQPSPRFAANTMQYPANISPIGYGFPTQQQQQYHQQSLPSPTYGRYAPQAVVNLPPPSPLGSPTANKSMSAHPLLTPSGRAFASGGKVVNISSDPLNPCVMYWPENEPFPEQGQIRPSGLMGVAQPPILNTGNRGPISHQPGDWICLKCNYLNWRRRKVCQTCLPYAEGNGDSISAAVQAERIALLTSVLAQTQGRQQAQQGQAQGQVSPPATPSHQHQHQHQHAAHPIGRSHSTTPAQAHRPFVNFSPPAPAPTRLPVHRSQSHSELGSQYMQGYPPIYQTSPQNQNHHQHHQQSQQQHQGQQQGQQQYHRQHFPSPLQRHTLPMPMDVGAGGGALDMYAPAPLLPSFLQDMVHSPTLSPASTSSADLSYEDLSYEESSPSSTRSTFSQSGGDSPLANIWRLDGEESKALTTFPPLPVAARAAQRQGQGLGLGLGSGSAGSSRNSSLERLRVRVSSS